MKKRMIRYFFLLLTFISVQLLSAQGYYRLSGQLSVPSGEELSKAEVFLQEKSVFAKVSKTGSFSFDSLQNGNYTLTVFAEGYQSINRLISINNASKRIELALELLKTDINEVYIEEKKTNSFGISRLKPVEGTAIYAGKKSEVIEVEDLAANLATNNARQVYSKVAGLNIWESDGAGIQLGIGGRGLNPNRVSNFNTRQNGYDISADALGYPESYYVPPAQALERIELVRGAASLQYGTQFGGLLNFKLKEGKEGDPFELISESTAGSFGLLSLFNSVGGSKGKTSYYGFHQYKRGNGWRPNSGL